MLHDLGNSVMLMRLGSLMARTKLGIENRIGQTHAHMLTHIVKTHKHMASQDIRDVCIAMEGPLADTQMVKKGFDEKR